MSTQAPVLVDAAVSQQGSILRSRVPTEVLNAMGATDGGRIEWTVSRGLAVGKAIAALGATTKRPAAKTAKKAGGTKAGGAAPKSAPRTKATATAAKKAGAIDLSAAFSAPTSPAKASGRATAPAKASKQFRGPIPKPSEAKKGRNKVAYDLGDDDV